MYQVYIYLYSKIGTYIVVYTLTNVPYSYDILYSHIHTVLYMYADPEQYPGVGGDTRRVHIPGKCICNNVCSILVYV